MTTEEVEFMTANKPTVDREQSYLDSIGEPVPAWNADSAELRLKADDQFGRIFASIASGKGKTPIADAQEQIRALMLDYQSLIALHNDANEYEWAYTSALLDQSNVAIAFNLIKHTVYVFASEDNRPNTQAFPFWLLDMAKQLTEVLQTFVVPDQGTDYDYYGKSPLGRDVLGYKFRMADTPESITPSGTASVPVRTVTS